MTVIHIGAIVDRPPGPKYRAHLAFAQVALRMPVPRPATLRKSREALGATVCALTVPRSAWVSQDKPLRLDDTLRTQVKWLNEAAKAIDARAIVLPTRGEVRTGPRDRSLLATYFEAVRMDGRHTVWAPTGLWEPEDAAAFAAEHGVVYGFDPLTATNGTTVGAGVGAIAGEAGEVVYFTLRGIGMRQRLGEGSLDRVLVSIEEALESGATEVFVAIDSERSVREATRLRSLLTGALAAGDADDAEDAEDDADDADDADDDEE